jgi:glycosyltransferase involved in cell wall biosynthesis
VTLSVSVIIPALDEEEAIVRVLGDLPKPGQVQDGVVFDIVVVDNGCTDRTSVRAEQMGARVIHEPRRGYGQACLAGLAAVDSPDIILFLDGDYSDYPEEAAAVIAPIRQQRADLVIGSRVLGERESGALLPQARAGNVLATTLIRLLYGVRYTDLGPFRAIRYSSLQQLQMSDRDYGWTVEMQVKAARQGLRIAEVPVRYRKRIGQSKISGTLIGTVRAGHKILWTIFRHARSRAAQ